MNKDTVQGSLEQASGKVKQALGEAIGNQKIANSGAAEQVKGAARETWGRVEETASEVAATKRTEIDAVHDVRAKVVSTAQNARDSVTNKFDEMKQKQAS